ncbi:hypothetical protein H9P43_009753 [Blastocladiella emersonii ATCC 22665]|nr:hypothetical protein H9P43_009753 [Blastocladiella emersonii ATCC 22665]
MRHDAVTVDLPLLSPTESTATASPIPAPRRHDPHGDDGDDEAMTAMAFLKSTTTPLRSPWWHRPRILAAAAILAVLALALASGSVLSAARRHGAVAVSAAPSVTAAVDDAVPAPAAAELDFSFLARERGNLAPLTGDLAAPRTPPLDAAHRQPGLLAVPVSKKSISRILPVLERFERAGFGVLLFHWDHDVWASAPATSRFPSVVAVNQTKFWFAKRFLTPQVVDNYRYVFLWDDDVGLPDGWDPLAFVKVLSENNLHIAQPALRSGVREYGQSAVVKQQPDVVKAGRVGRLTSFVEVMMPVFSREAWQNCVYESIPWDGHSYWGLDFAWYPHCASKGYCRLGVVDAMPVDHLDTRSLNQATDANMHELGAYVAAYTSICENPSTAAGTPRGRAICEYLARFPLGTHMASLGQPQPAPVDAQALAGDTLSRAVPSSGGGGNDVFVASLAKTAPAPEYVVLKSGAAPTNLSPAVRDTRPWWKRKRNWPIVAALTFLVVSLGATMVGAALMYRGERAMVQAAAYAPPSSVKDYIAMEVKLRHLDLDAGVGQVAISKIVPYGKYASGSGSTFLRERTELFVNGNQFVLDAGFPAREIEAPFSFTGGQIAKYPFDKHAASISVYAMTTASRSALVASLATGTGAVTANPMIPVKMVLFGGVQSLSLNATVDTNLADVGMLQTRVRVSRSPLTKLFSVLVLSLLWALSIAMLAVAVDTLLHRKDVSPSLLLVNGGMLFALPTLRNVQPGVTALGTTSDVVGFFWNMAIACVAFVLLAGYWVYLAAKAHKKATAAAQ